MTIPFLDIFKKATARFRQTNEPAVALSTRLPATEKPSGERLSKTVMPNAARAPKPDVFHATADASPNIKLSVPRPAQLPPSVALALQPKVERAISLHLRDLLDQLPAGFVKPVESFDPSQPILLKASEIEKGMATGKPVVSLATIYEQVPEIFLRTVSPDDTTLVGLPFDKVLAQFQNVQLRADQDQEYDVPQLDTPFLQVTLEDTQRFGTALQTVQTSARPQVRVEPATARAHSSAEPEPAVQETRASAAPRGIPLNISVAPTALPPLRPVAPVSTPDPLPSPGSPARIPFQLPANGTGGSAIEKVPASSEPSVPLSAPAPNVPAARIPFKISPPCSDLKPKFTLVPGTAVKETESAGEPQSAPASAKSADVEKTVPVFSVRDEDSPLAKVATELPDQKAPPENISLGLRSILQNMPAFQLNGSPDTVATDVRIDLPLALIQSQLATGRIALSAKAFQEALPEAHREIVMVDDAESPVLLPLQEVLKNLPSTVLKMRDDQEAVDEAAAFVTPFSIKAAEDAKRLSATAAPASLNTTSVSEKSASTPAPAPATPVGEKTDETASGRAEPSLPVEEKVEAKGKAEPAPVATEPSLDLEQERVLEPEVKLEGNTNAKEIVTRVSALPGVMGCSISFEDGLSLAGNLPEDVHVGGLCAMAPSVLQRIDRHTGDTKLGPLISMTLHCQKSQMSFYMKGNVCLTVLHGGSELAAGTRDKLAEMARELSRTYSQPETVHVDH